MTELPDGITAVLDPMPGYRVETSACTGLVLRHGAHVLDWAPTGHQNVLWTSRKSHFEIGTPIRGGVPICFPWFGNGRSGDLKPAHGFARIVEWPLVDVAVDEDGTATLVFELRGDDVTSQPHSDHFPPGSIARYTVRMGAKLDLALTVVAGAERLDVEEALHTYFSVGNITKTHLVGLDNSPYWNKVTGHSKCQVGDVRFEGETDRIYKARGSVSIVDELLGRKVKVGKDNSAKTVVWNPWVDKAKGMPDFSDEEWTGMLCVETANVGDALIHLAPGESHTMCASIEIVIPKKKD
ncbi:MAG TPA: D-hexose-6-phosphate mutarotase [Propionibacteriaceae bacterium]|nr:D-hexose-6-phosphate mutarotase [Propionibacteriaceae bacterium]